MKKIISMLATLLGVAFASSEAGMVKSVKGDVSVIRGDGKQEALKVGDKIYEKDTIKTSAKSAMGLIFNDNTLVSVGQNSEFKINEYLFEPSEKKVAFRSEVVKGSIACMTGLISKINPDAMKLKAKTATMGIRGTYFAVEVNE
jgi:hypothetical protein